MWRVTPPLVPRDLLAGGTLGGYDATLANDIVAVDSTTSTIVPVDTLTLNGNISGSGTIICTNVTYGGISDGLLELGGDNSNFTGTFNQWEDTANGTIATNFTSASAGSGNATWQIDGGVLATAVPGTPTIALGALSGSGGTLSNALAGSTVTYQIGGNGQTSEFDGTIEDGLGTVALTKVGAGTLTLTGTNTYGGDTTIDAGILEAKNAGSLSQYTTFGSVVVNDGGTLALNVGGTGDWTGSEISTLLPNVSFNSGSALGIDTADGNFTYGMRHKR